MSSRDSDSSEQTVEVEESGVSREDERDREPAEGAREHDVETQDRSEPRESPIADYREKEAIAEGAMDIVFNSVAVLLGLVCFIIFALGVAMPESNIPFLGMSGFVGVGGFLILSMKELIKTIDEEWYL